MGDGNNTHLQAKAVATKANIPGQPSTFTFTVVLDGVDELNDRIENKLAEAGCEDASPLLGAGVVFLKFDREAGSLSGAVASAIDDVEAAGYRIASIGIGDRGMGEVREELSAWEAASDEDFAAFESRLE